MPVSLSHAPPPLLPTPAAVALVSALVHIRTWGRFSALRWSHLLLSIATLTGRRIRTVNSVPWKAKAAVRLRLFGGALCCRPGTEEKLPRSATAPPPLPALCPPISTARASLPASEKSFFLTPRFANSAFGVLIRGHMTEVAVLPVIARKIMGPSRLVRTEMPLGVLVKQLNLCQPPQIRGRHSRERSMRQTESDSTRPGGGGGVEVHRHWQLAMLK